MGRVRCTCGKVPYVSQKSAKRALKKMAIDRALAVGGEKVPFRAYYSSQCGCWHLTSQERRK
jgi:hypothetical protein